MRLHGGGQQRVHRAHTVTVDHNDAGVERGVKRVLLRDRRELRDAQLGVERDREEYVAHRLG
jgi:hypothetical protein